MIPVNRNLPCALTPPLLLSEAGYTGTVPDPASRAADRCFYVSPDGDDRNDGSASFPFATVERAAEAARSVPEEQKTIRIHAGTYKTEGLRFTEKDSGCSYAAFGDGEVVIHGGTLIPGSDLDTPGEDFLARLPEGSRDRVLCVDLTRYGLTKDKIAPIHAIGSSPTASKYDGDYVGPNGGVFWNDARMTLARYPNEGYTILTGVFEQGDPGEYPEQNYTKGWADRRNHESGLYCVDRTNSEHIQRWRDLTDVWMYGCFYHDWADSSTPILSFDPDRLALKPKFVSRYGARAGGTLYFYNIPEEIDMPGEYWIDRENALLYVYPLSDPADSRITLTMSDTNLITAEGVSGMEFRGLTLTGCMCDGIVLSGNNNRIENCTIRNVDGDAIRITGYDNIVAGCDISHTGRGGIRVAGGDRDTLTPANNLVTQNYIHDWSEVYQTYQAGISLSGVGCIASHNELCRSPHLAISFGGNDHIIEYNDIHDVVRESNDAGAIYGGRDWAGCGTVIRCNIVRDLGSEWYHPCGIYLDDALSGITICRNAVIRSDGNPLLIGGGRDNRIVENLIINPVYGMCFDARARDGFFDRGWFSASVNDRSNSCMWKGLDAVPYRSEIWAAKYPHLASVKDSFDCDKNDPDFPPNPAWCVVRGNRFFSDPPAIDPSVAELGTVEDNTTSAYETAKEYFRDPENNDFTLLKEEGIPPIPFGEIGRLRPAPNDGKEE